MRKILLGLVVFVLYLIQAQGDSNDILADIKFNPKIQAELDRISDAIERAKERKFYLDLIRVGMVMGISKGEVMGISKGIAIAEGSNFLSSFECATNGLKGILERAYKCKNISPGVKDDYKDLQIPHDILQVMKTNDAWVRTYNSEKSNKNTPAKIDEPTKPVKAQNSVEKIVATTNKRETPESYQAGIEKSFRTWYALLAVKDARKMTPPFLNDLRALLKDFQINNADKYVDIDEVFVRFAAQMARSYEIMCALHYQLNKIIRSYGEQHREMEFHQILFKFAPEWHMSEEQYQFLNMLRLTIPQSLSTLDRIFVKNGKGDWVVLPYDHSADCGRMMINKLPTTPMDMTTLVSVVPTNDLLKDN